MVIGHDIYLQILNIRWEPVYISSIRRGVTITRKKKELAIGHDIYWQKLNIRWEPVYILNMRREVTITRKKVIYTNKKEMSDFHGTLSFDPVKMSQQK